MAIPSKSHIEPEKNRDPAEAGRDPQQLTAQREHGASYELYEEIETVQSAGDRNDGVTDSDVNEHNTEPVNAPAPWQVRTSLQEARSRSQESFVRANASLAERRESRPFQARLPQLFADRQIRLCELPQRPRFV